MNRPDRAILQRYWRDRHSTAFGEDESAALYALGLGLDVGIMAIEAATAGRCTVLLGPPGAGKTTELQRLTRDPRQRARLVSFGSTGSEDRLRRKIDDAVTILTEPGSAFGGALPCLVLDSLDESTLTTTQLVGFFEDLLPELPKDLRLAVACRSAGWQHGVEHILRQHYSEVAIFDIAALTTSDIQTYASSSGADGALFLQAVETVKALPLATAPNTLSLLVDEYLAGGRAATGLSHTQTELYERSCARLVGEPERKQSPLQPQEVPKLLATVGHLAVVSLFTGKNSFVLVGEGRQDELNIHDCLPASVTWYDNADKVSLTPSLLAEGLATAIFTGAGENRVRFAHQTLAEFLAARHLLGTGLSDKQIDGLLRGRGGLLAPQVQAVAAWLISLAPARFHGLLNDDPAAFVLSSVELTDPNFRESLVTGLLDLAERSELQDYWAINLGGLRYQHIEDRLRSVLANPKSSIDARYLALRLVRANRLDGLLDTLVALALDGNEGIPLRNAAGHAVLDFDSLGHIQSLTVLAEANGSAHDEDDELFGLGLLARLRSGTSPAALLTQLRTESNTDLFGSYRSFLIFALPEALQSPGLAREALLTALEWAASVEGCVNQEPTGATGLLSHAEQLFDAILVGGLRRLGEPDVLAAVAHLIVVRIDAHHDVRLARETELPEVPDQLRHSLLEALQQEFSSHHDVWLLYRSTLLLADDLLWVTRRAATVASDDERTKWALWIRATYDQNRPDHQAALTRLLSEVPEYKMVLRYLLEPPEPPTPVVSVHEEEPSSPPPTDDELRRRLVDCLSLDDRASFFNWCYWAQFSGGQRYSRGQLELDVRKLSGWLLHTMEQHKRVVALAERYLREAEPEVDGLLGTDQYNTGACAGARALVLLAALGIHIDLPDARWRFWAPVLVHCPFGSTNDGLLAQPLRQMSHKATDALLAAAEREMRGMPEFGQFTLRRLTPALTTAAIPWLVHLIDNTESDDPTAGVAFGQFLALDQSDALRLLQSKLTTPGTEVLPGRVHRMVAVALGSAASTAWDVTYDALSGNDGLASDVIGSLAYSEQFDATGLTENQVIRLWELVDRLFPPDTDPVVRGVHEISVRESIGRFRHRLLPALADRATVAAAALLQQLAESRPQDASFRYLAARADAALRRADWTPLKPREILTMLASAKRVLRNDQDLLNVVVDAVEQIQMDLRGATPAATLLWNHAPGCRQRTGRSCMPKSEDEISDYLNREIARRIPGAVVNREVQVTRLQTSGIGQRTDLLVQVPAPADSNRILTVVIEVKGCWNDEISYALEDQLVTRYLNKWPGSTGVFLVAWFDPSHGFKPGKWLNDLERKDRKVLEDNLTTRADAASVSSGHTVRSFVLDCSMPS